MMKKRTYTYFFFVLTVFIFSCKNKEINNTENPNVILIFADDMGYGDVGFLGATDILTPSIDKLAKSGVIFNQGYVTASVCGPSRSGILTGVYQQRIKADENIPEDDYPTKRGRIAGIPLTQSMLPELLKPFGYHTGVIGKWHVGLDEAKRPLSRGFDEFYGFLNGSHSYYKSTMEFGSNHGLWPIFRNEKKVEFNGYTTDVFSDEAVNFIERNKDEPFFLYLSYNAVHHPWEVPDAYVDRVKHIEDEDRRLFSGMMLAMDDGVGRVMKTLKEHNLDENTLIFFISDNGSPKGQSGTMSNTGGLRGWKGDTYEGGIRVPFTVSWPGIIPENSIYEYPVSTLDVVATITASLGIKKPLKGFDFDGVDLVPFVNGNKNKNERPHDVMYWRRKDDYAIRVGDWKLEWNDDEPNRNVELFNLAEDPYEKKDLSEKYPEKLAELQDKFDAWDSQQPDSEVWPAPINRNYDYGK